MGKRIWDMNGVWMQKRKRNIEVRKKKHMSEQERLYKERLRQFHFYR